MRYDAFTQRIMDAVLAGPGHTPSELRRAVLARAARLAGARSGAPAPAPFATYVDKVAQHAYKVTDEDIAAARASGLSEDQIFEIVVCAAIGQATRQYETALAALRAAGEKE